jgi:hypothetical protein
MNFRFKLERPDGTPVDPPDAEELDLALASRRDDPARGGQDAARR